MYMRSSGSQHVSRLGDAIARTSSMKNAAAPRNKTPHGADRWSLKRFDVRQKKEANEKLTRVQCFVEKRKRRKGTAPAFDSLLIALYRAKIRTASDLTRRLDKKARA